MNKSLISFICFLPLINILVDIFTSDKGFHLGDIRALVIFILVFIFFSKNYIKLDGLTVLIIVFLLYLFILVLLSSNFNYSFFNNYTKVFLSYLMFPLGFYIINNYSRLLKLNYSIILMGLVLIINYVLAQVFKFGKSDYLEDSFYTGAVGAGTTSMLVLPVIIMPFFTFLLQNEKKYKKYLVYGVAFISVIIVLIMVKRAAIIGIAGAVLTLVFLLKEQRRSAISRIILITGFLFMFYPLYENVLMERVQARSYERNKFEKESRYAESNIVFSEFTNGSLKHKLFGTECFNSPDYFSDFFAYNRQLHVDYMVLLHGSGIIGLIIFLTIYLMMTLKMNRFSKLSLSLAENSHDMLIIIHVRALFISLIVASLLVSFSGGLAYFSLRALFLLYLGGLLGFIRSKIMINENSNTIRFIKN